MGTSKRISLSSTDVGRSDEALTWNHYAPATHGMLRIDLDIENEIITSARPILGSMHRGAEKLFESRDYRQVLGLANRHEWLSAFSGEVGVATLVERELGIDIPQSARWLRTLLLETFRITSHLAFLSSYPWRDDALANELRIEREKIVNLIRGYTGSRMHPMLTQIGGLTHAPSRRWLVNLAELMQTLQESIALQSERSWNELALLKGIGKLSAAEISKHAVSGPVARASGVAIDIRQKSDWLMYSALESFSSPTHEDGDIPARIQQLFDEVKSSCRMAAELAEATQQFENSEVNVLTPKVLRVPEGEYQHSIETPLGIAQWLLISKGDKYPYRLALRPASLHTILALSPALVGENEQHLQAIVGSMPFITGDADR